MSRAQTKGFTLIELLVVIIIIGILSAIFVPRYWEVARQARIATLEGVAGAMRSAINITRANALSQGIQASTTEVSQTNQSAYIVQMEGFTVEVDWRNLCPESKGEHRDDASMLDFISLTRKQWSNAQAFDGELYADYDNQYTWVGYDIVKGINDPGGCYVRYDSFGNPECTVEIIMDDC